MSSGALRAGISRTAYPESHVPPLEGLDEIGQRLAAPLARRRRARLGDARTVLERINALEPETAALADPQMAGVARELGGRLARRGLEVETVARVFALVREAARRTLFQRPYDVQLHGGWVMLQGMLAEMETGEGKTLTATLPAAAVALAGLPVHIVTVNDYLAARDAEKLRPLYALLGLRVGLIQEGMTPDQRRAAYAADVTYCTNKELAFDYLKDRITLGRVRSRAALRIERLSGRKDRARELVLRGLCFAIIDEADSVLIDEARTPLIISAAQEQDEEEDLYETALELAAALEAGRDFLVERRERSLRLTDAGEEKLEALAGPLGGLWQGPRRRADLVRQALSAIHLFERDKHYILGAEGIEIVDEFTGRRMPDRAWERGLHQMIEMKEDCELTGRRETLARMSYQRFFGRYQRLAGMTGTAHEVRGELWSVYGLAVVRIPTHRPSRRIVLPERIFDAEEEKWDAVAERVAMIHATGRPILIGTISVEASERLSERLTKRDLAHRVLNARQDETEAEIVARAGERGRITVATNMAGRGTDIVLGEGVAELGGLYVIATTRHEAARIDRQLRGRCGRQGDPGTFESLVSLDDELVEVHGAGWLRPILGKSRAASAGWQERLRRLAFDEAQRRAERYHSAIRRRLLKSDRKTESMLSFSGVAE